MGHLTTGFWPILGVGLALLVIAALADRAARLSAERRAVAPPDRDVPGLDEQAPVPAYVPEPTRLRVLNSARPSRLPWTRNSRPTSASTSSSPIPDWPPTGRGPSSTTSWSSSADAVGELRELLQSLERALKDARPHRRRRALVR